MGATSETRNYTALLSTTLENWATGIEDEISNSNFFFHMIRKNGSYVGVEDLGERAKYSLRYVNGTADTYNGYDPLNLTPIDGMTAAFYNWVQMAVPITISRIEERKNSGKFQQLDLLDEKTSQALSGIQELFGKATLAGNGVNSAAAITTAYTSPNNASVFYSPLPLLIGHSPTSGTIGSIAANVSDNGVSWWANQQAAATDTNYASFLKDLSKLRNNCTKGVGGAPDIHLADQATYEFYEACLRSFHHNMDYKRADIPFDNILFHGKPVTWDEFLPNWSGATTAQSTTQGTWVMINSQFYMIKYDKATNFLTTPFIRPVDQDAKAASILWYGTSGVTNRRKHGVLDDINTTLTS